MFFVFNSKKAKSYLISVSTVVILLLMAIVLQNNTGANKTVKTSTGVSSTPISQIATDETNIAFTVNCIKNMNDINNILDTLSKAKAKATFFVTGDIASKYPEEVKKIVNNGNEIGNLSSNYTSLKNMSKDEIIKQITDANDAIEKVTGKKPTLFRSPYGEYNNNIMDSAKSLNMEVIGWNVDSLDYNELSNDEIWERIEESLSNGCIILTHNEYIGSSLELILHNIQEKKYNITTVSDLIE